MKKNQGFTFIELLVSITILAILFTPILHGFLTSARLNQKAKQVQEATTVAQNTVEAIQAEVSTETLIKQLKGQEMITLSDANQMGTLLKKTGDEYVVFPGGEILDGNLTYTAYSLSQNGKNYDVIITMDDAQYKNVSDKQNNYRKPILPSLNSETSAIFDIADYEKSFGYLDNIAKNEFLNTLLLAADEDLISQSNTLVRNIAAQMTKQTQIILDGTQTYDSETNEMTGDVRVRCLVTYHTTYPLGAEESQQYTTYEVYTRVFQGHLNQIYYMCSDITYYDNIIIKNLITYSPYTIPQEAYSIKFSVIKQNQVITETIGLSLVDTKHALHLYSNMNLATSEPYATTLVEYDAVTTRMLAFQVEVYEHPSDGSAQWKKQLVNLECTKVVSE